MNSEILSDISGTDCHIAGPDKEDQSSPHAKTTTSSSSAQRRDSVFLVLSPSTSENYASQASPPAGELSPRSTSIPSVSSSLSSAVVEPVQKNRRSSSTGSSGLGKRYLKLGPIHSGETNTSDYVDVEE